MLGTGKKPQYKWAEVRRAMRSWSGPDRAEALPRRDRRYFGGLTAAARSSREVANYHAARISEVLGCGSRTPPDAESPPPKAVEVDGVLERRHGGVAVAPIRGFSIGSVGGGEHDCGVERRAAS